MQLLTHLWSSLGYYRNGLTWKAIGEREEKREGGGRGAKREEKREEETQRETKNKKVSSETHM